MSQTPDKTRTMYAGEVTLDYTDTPHRYTFEGGRKVSATQITGMIDDGKTYRLQNWAVKMFRLALMKSLMDLIPAGDNVLTATASTLAELVTEASKAHTRKLKKAGEIGSVVHGLVEQHIKNKLEDPYYRLQMRWEKGTPKAIKSGFNAFLAWERKHKVRYVATELLVYSKEHDYAGTLDILAYVDDVLSIIDIKTSNYLYETFELQVAGYVGAYNEEVKYNIDRRWTRHNELAGDLIRGRHIVQLHKENGTFTHEDLGEDNTRDFEAFLAALTLYRRFKK